MAKEIGKQVKASNMQQQKSKINIFSNLYDYIANKTNPAHADIDHKHRLSKHVIPNGWREVVLCQRREMQMEPCLVMLVGNRRAE